MDSFADARVVRLGEMAVARATGRLAALGLGSCVAAVLYDPAAKVGGMAHVMLPSADFSRDDSIPARFADQAITLLVDAMGSEGADGERLHARLIGGASMFVSLLPRNVPSIGQRNVETCRAALRALHIPIVAEDVGEQKGRSTALNVADGTVLVRTARGEERHV